MRLTKTCSSAHDPLVSYVFKKGTENQLSDPIEDTILRTRKAILDQLALLDEHVKTTDPMDSQFVREHARYVEQLAELLLDHEIKAQ